MVGMTGSRERSVMSYAGIISFITGAGVKAMVSVGTSDLEQLSEHVAVISSLRRSFSANRSFCQISSKVSQDGAKGGSAKEHAFHPALTGTPS